MELAWLFSVVLEILKLTLIGSKESKTDWSITQ